MSILNTIFLFCFSSSVLIIVTHFSLRFMILINKKKISRSKLTNFFSISLSIHSQETTQFMNHSQEVIQFTDCSQEAIQSTDHS